MSYGFACSGRDNELDWPGDKCVGRGNGIDWDEGKSYRTVGYKVQLRDWGSRRNSLKQYQREAENLVVKHMERKNKGAEVE